MGQNATILEIQCIGNIDRPVYRYPTSVERQVSGGGQSTIEGQVTSGEGGILGKTDIARHLDLCSTG